MLRMILADDEPVISSGLQRLIDWKTLGLEIIGVFDDGSSAMEAILRDQPDLALLDISMPGIDGIRILKNIRDLSLSTKVIFISGFQDFQYAKSAVSYGAVEYLLKPVIKEELLNAVEKAVMQIRIPGKELPEEADDSETDAQSIKDMQVKAPGQELQTYLPVLADFLPPDDAGRQEKKLMRFAYFSFLRQYLEQNPSLGLLFENSPDTMILLKNTDPDDVEQILDNLCTDALQYAKGIPSFIVEDRISSLEEVPESLIRCRERKGELFFAHPGRFLIVYPEKTGSDSAQRMEALSRLRNQLLNDMLAMKPDRFEKDYEQFAQALRRASAGRKEDACYYFCSTIRLVEERVRDHHLEGLSPDMKELLEQARSCENFESMKMIFLDYLIRYQKMIRSHMSETEKRDILQIKEYIDQHYRENLSLEVMGQEFFMNSYYFSSYFKKQTGTNFKDYLSYVRIQHAISLLLTTNMKTYEVAAAVGFSDVRAFTDAFVKRYGETPSAYKKRSLENI
ncbi:MAG: response regulator [Blautia sp.]|nr:response regulator [Blautia sp.]